MEHGIVGTTMPVLELMLQPGQQVFAESGELAWISMAIQLQTGTAVGGQEGGFMSVPGRAMAGATIFMTEYTAAGGLGMVASCAKLPGQIMPLELHPGRGYMELYGEVVPYDLQAGNTDVPRSRRDVRGLGGLQRDHDARHPQCAVRRGRTLSGHADRPTRIWLQSMSMSHLAHDIAHYLPHHSESGLEGLLAGS